jgi:hypothetical protein
MTPAGFRRIALSLPEAMESAHMGHPDFRVRGKIFATLFHRGGEDFGMVKLKPPQQRQRVADHPETFEPIKGGWGRQGCTQVRLGDADRAAVKDAIFTAWCNVAPKSLVEKLSEEAE